MTPRPATAPELPTLPFKSVRAFETWLGRNHAKARGVWIKLAKKGSGVASVTYTEALEVALCYGWIDGQTRRFDETFYVQRFTPRGPRSLWSKINRERVAALISACRMQPPGLAEIERAKRDGRWDRAYDPPSLATVPDDLAAALDGNPRAAAFFASLDATNRYAVLHRIMIATTPAGRARRIADLVGKLARREKLHP